jgi:hypothetical protein
LELTANELPSKTRKINYAPIALPHPWQRHFYWRQLGRIPSPHHRRCFYSVDESVRDPGRSQEFARRRRLKPEAALPKSFTNADLLATVRIVLGADNGNEGRKETMLPEFL